MADAVDVLILAGKRPRAGTILAAVEGDLTGRGMAVRVDWRDAPGALDAASGSPLVIHRGLAPRTLAALAARGPGRIVNPPGACLAAADRGAALAALRSASIPVPDSLVTGEWIDVRRWAGGGPAFLKAASGAAGRGVGVVALPHGAPPDPPMPGPWHVERALPADGVDRKLYVVGDRVFGLLKPWPRDGGPGEAFDPPAPLADLARAAGRALGLEIYGVDLVGRADRFGIVDVNPFPGFRGVAGAADAVADHIAARAAR